MSATTARLVLTLAVALGAAGGDVFAQGQPQWDRDGEYLIVEGQAAPGGEAAENLPQAAERIVELANRFRQEHDLAPLASDPQLAAAAQAFAEYMADSGRFGHTADGRQPGERVDQEGYEYCLILENIGHQFSTRGLATDELARRFVEAWQQSPEHRDALLEPAVQDTGVGVAFSEDSGHFFAVQKFGRPLDEQIEFTLINRSGREVEYQLGERRYRLPAQFAQSHQRCRPSDVILEPDATAERLTPDDGGRYVIGQDAQGGLSVAAE